MKYKDLRDFIAQLEQRGLLHRISAEIDPVLEMTEIADRTLRAGGPALLFENPKGYDIPVLANLFGTPERVALGMGQTEVSALREVGKLLAFLKEPEPPKGLKDAFSKLPIFKQVLNMSPKEVRKSPLSASGEKRRCGRLNQITSDDLLARRCRAAHHLGFNRDPRSAQRAAEFRHLPPAGAW